MTAKRDSKSKPKKDERPKIKKEKLRDLEAKDSEKVKAGRRFTHGACMTDECSL